MTWHDLLHQKSTVSFERKILFSASQDLAVTRSKLFKPTESRNQSDSWSIKSPEFSVKLYSRQTFSPKKRINTNPKAALAQSSATGRIKERLFPNIVHAGTKTKAAPKFITTHRPPDALQSELMFVRRGKFPPGPYRNPKPHNFRPLAEGLPDMITTYEKDPGNVTFKVHHLDTLRTTRSEVDSSSRSTKTGMDTFKPAEPTWDPTLFLPPLPWPPKSASYTRHKRRRGAYTAFLDRVEEKLSQSWTIKS